MSNYPQGWESKLLGKVFPKIVVGYVGNVNDHYCSENEGVPFYRTLNIRDGYFRHVDLKYVTHTFNDKNKKSQISNDDILIARVGANLGMVCKATGINGSANMANAIIIKTNLTTNADADFFTYFLLSPMGKNQIFSGAAGGAQGVFNTKLTQEIKVPVPPLPEQRKIAKILSTWDKAISTTERLIDNSKQQKKALMQQLLTGKKRLLDVSGKPFEGEWDVERFEQLFDIEIGGTPSRRNESYWDSKHETNNNWLSIADLKGKFIAKTSERISDLGVKNSNVTLIPKGTIVMSFKLTIGRRAFLDIDTYTNEAICALSIKRQDKVDNNYLYQALGVVDFDQEIDQAVKGKTLNKAKLKCLKLLLPCVEEQVKIASVLNNADQEIELLEQKLADLKQEKKALMQQLLTGKRRVKIDEKEVA